MVVNGIKNLIQNEGLEFYVVSLSPQFYKKMARAGLIKRLGSDAFFQTVEGALRHLSDERRDFDHIGI